MMIRQSTRSLHFTRAAMLVMLAFTCQSAHAGLVVGDFLAVGDQFLVTDTVTNLEWLKPIYTTFETYDSAAVQQIRSNYGFRYATEDEVVDMINANFGNPPLAPGSGAGYLAAQAFFAVFDINVNMTCGFPATPCPRTQGLTSSPSIIANRHDAVGMIILDSNGWLIRDNAWPDNLSDSQMGSWLVREASSSPVPEPGTWGLFATGAAAIALRVRTWRRRSDR